MNGELIGIINAKHGELSGYLKQICELPEDRNVSISIGGVDPVQALQKVAAEMRQNMNLSIGYAIRIDLITQTDIALNGYIIK
jgi:hypothetical protein